ncbi:MAG: hypothetical protein VX642_11375 [Bdellovibrionota bacterium]|nr:hypothetical protein [Bdellovibrionota bacterium]
MKLLFLFFGLYFIVVANSKALAHSDHCQYTASIERQKQNSRLDSEHTKDPIGTDYQKLVAAYAMIYPSKSLDRSRLIDQHTSAMVAFFNKNKKNFNSFSAFVSKVIADAQLKISHEKPKSLEAEAKKPTSKQGLIGLSLLRNEDKRTIWSSKNSQWRIVRDKNSKNEIRVEHKRAIPVFEIEKKGSFQPLAYKLSAEHILEWNSGLILKLSKHRNYFFYLEKSQIKVIEMNYIFNIDTNVIHYTKPSSPENTYLASGIYSIKQSGNKTENKLAFETETFNTLYIFSLNPNTYFINSETGNIFSQLRVSGNTASIIQKMAYEEVFSSFVNMTGFFFLEGKFKKYLEITHEIDGELVTEKVALPFFRALSKHFIEGNKTFYRLDENNFFLSIQSPYVGKNSKTLWFKRDHNGYFKIETELSYLVIEKHSQDKNRLIARDLSQNWFLIDLADAPNKVQLPLKGKYRFIKSFVVGISHNKYEVYKLDNNFNFHQIVFMHYPQADLNTLKFIQAEIINDEHLISHSGPGTTFYTNLKKANFKTKRLQSINYIKKVESETNELYLVSSRWDKRLSVVEFKENEIPDFQNMFLTDIQIDFEIFEASPAQHIGDNIMIGNDYRIPLENFNKIFEIKE